MRKGNKMKVLRTMLLCLIAIGLIFSVAFAASDVERGKKLFNDATAFGGRKACSACHPNGRGLGRAGSKKKFGIMGGTQDSLEEAVNLCIVNASKGQAIAEDSEEMKDIVAYIKSLGK
jgi:cytochrome c